MAKNSRLRRSRSWRDLSLFTKMGFSKDSPTVVPAVPLNRSSSLGRLRVRTETNNRNTQYTASRIWGETPVQSAHDQRAKERDFQRKASIKRKAVPSGVFTPPLGTTTPASRRPSTSPQTSQLPAFTFSTKALEPSPIATSVLPPPRSHSKSASQSKGTAHVKSVSVSTQNSMVSEMSIPMVLDFDLARPQRNPSHSTLARGGGVLDFGFTAEIVQTPLTEEEKQHLINSISPMHVVTLPSSSAGSSPKPRRSSTLKRIFSLRRTDRSNSPRPSNHTRSESTKHPFAPSTPPDVVIPNLEGTNSRTIYARPPGTEYRRDMVPRLTVQIPDSTMDRASKIFQSIYSAHAAALEKVTHTHSRDQSWGYPTPVSATSTTSKTVYEIPATVETRVSRFSRDHRPAPRPAQRMSREIRTPISRSQSPATRGTRSSSIYSTPISRSQSPATRNSNLISSRSQSPAKRNSRTLKSSKRLSAFPVPPSMNSARESVVVVDLSDVESETSEDWREDELEIESVGSKGTKIKEPEWEMLTPVARSIVV